MPKISVVMPAYNAEKYIREAIDSILAQTFTDFEFIIIDDGSKDSTAAIVQSYSDSRIRFYQNERNMGVAATLNRGLDLAQGEYIARMDADDISLPERFEKQVDVLDNNKSIAICGSNAIVFSQEREYTTNLPEESNKIRDNLFISSPFIHPAVMIRKNIMLQNGIEYDLRFEGREDYQLWMKFSLLKYEFYNISQPLIRYRQHSNQVTQKIDSDLLKKHTEMKIWYLNLMGIPFTQDEINVLSRVSVGEVLNSSDQISALKDIFVKINMHFGRMCISNYFLLILYNQAKTVLPFHKMIALCADQQAKVQLKWWIYIIRGVL